jgi:hypothetical protein
MNLGLWDKVCEYKGWSEWIYNEGRIDETELVEFDDEFKKETEIGFHEAIEIIRNEGEVKVEYQDGKINYIDQFDGLDGLRFRDFFEAKFYTNY